MKFLVTGDAGLAGTHPTELLVSQGRRVLREVGSIKLDDRRLNTDEQRAAENGGDDLEVRDGEADNGSRSPLSTRRGEAYLPDLELRKLVARFMENRLENQLTAGSSRLAALPAPSPARAWKPPS